MNIIHTSDWHIGQRLYGKDRIAEHQFFFDFLFSIIKKQHIDALVVSGDIFDVGYPSNSAEELYFNFLTSLLTTSCKTIIITGGNHDSVSTLNAPKNILKHLNIIILGGLEDNLENHIIKLDSNDSKVIIAAIPYLRDKDLIKSVAGQSYEEKKEMLRTELIQLYNNIDNLINEKYPHSIKIFTGHFHTDGSKLSDSEREIHFGNLGVINVQKLPKVDYWALGHIHRPQKIGKKENIRYSGSPIPLSFSERKDEKEVILLTIENNKIAISEIKVPNSRRLKRIKGNFAEVNQKLDIIEHSTYELKPWLEVIISENLIDIDEKTRFIEKINELKNCEILKYKFIATDLAIEITTKEAQNLNDMSNQELFEHFLEKKGEKADEEIIFAYKEIVELVSTQNSIN